MFHSLVKGSIILAIVFATALTAAFIYAYEEVSLDADKLINYKPETSSIIFDRNGNKLAYVFKKQHRLYARYDEIPGHIIEGLVAMEDTQFFEHSGVNPDAIIRAIVKDLKAGKFVEGGSTLTQQLIKNKLLTNEKKLARKLKEAILAMKIEHELSKEDILERYLNEISYGNNYFGVKTAANGYFHKELHELTLKESAILVGLPNAPSYYNPLKHKKRAFDRANNVLYRMKSIGWITKGDYLKAVKESPKIYKTSLAQNIAPGIVDEVLRRFKGKLGDIRTGGYEIYTTIDMQQQAIAEGAVDFVYRNALKKYKESDKTSTLSAGFVAVESSTGDILAMVGGTDYKKSAFNRATQSNRQPGSAFKPFIYQTALDMGYNPATSLTDLARTFQYFENGKPKVWSPKNYEGDFQGFVSLREALVHSRNLATINLVSELGVKTIRKRLAFLDVPHIPRDMSIALGNLGLSPLKMAQIFSVFANKGHMVEPRLVSKVISREGAVIFETRTKEIEGFTTPEQAYLMTDILMDVVKRGTGKNAKVEGIELAGKTGTTNNNIDAWFCGYSPTIEAIVWIGRDDNKRIGAGATGGALAAPAFAYYFEKLLKLYPDTKRTFDIPPGVFRGEYDGKMELYTALSPFPAIKIEEAPMEEATIEEAPIQEEESPEDAAYRELLGEEREEPAAQETQESLGVQNTEVTLDVEPEEPEIEMAATVEIEEEPLNEEEVDTGLFSDEEMQEQEDADPLHPEAKVPTEPTYEESESLF